MRAAVVSALGSPPTVTEHPDPVAPDGGAVVRVTAAPVVPLDLLCATGTSYFGPPAVPYVPGVQGVGVVEQGDAMAPGTRVWFATSAGMRPGDGALAERCAVAGPDLVPLTAAITDVEAASLGLSAVAGWMALTWRGAMQPGETVVVLGAAGAVGQVAVAAARARGAARVVAVCRAGASTERARAGAADEVVSLPPDADVAELVARVTAALGGATVDVVVDPVGGWVAEAALQLLGPGGRLVNLGGSASDTSAWSSALLRGRHLSLLGYTNNALSAEQRASALRAVWELAEVGGMAVAHEARPLADVAEVWSAMASGRAPSRQVLTL